MELTDLEIEIVKILTPLIENPNAPDEYGDSNSCSSKDAAYKSGHIFVFFDWQSQCSIAPNKRENTPMHLTINNGHKEIVQIFTKIVKSSNLFL